MFNSIEVWVLGPAWVSQLAGAFSWTPNVVGLIPGQGKYRRQLTNVSLSHWCFSLSLPLSLKMNIYILCWELKKKSLSARFLSLSILSPKIQYWGHHSVYPYSLLGSQNVKKKWHERCEKTKLSKNPDGETTTSHARKGMNLGQLTGQVASELGPRGK